MTGSPQKDHQYFIPNLHTPRFVVEELGKDDDQLAGAALIAVRGTTGGWVKKKERSFGDVRFLCRWMVRMLVEF